MFVQLFTISMFLVLPGPDGHALTPAEFDLHPLERQVIEQTNSQRALLGLAPLVVDSGLATTAREHTAWMTNSQTLVHTTLPVAENIAMGQLSAVEVVQAWMDSPGHRANILNPEHRRIGVAAYSTPDGTVYWCQQFLQ
jgi:uncharacterized protein YkwD